MTITPCAPSAGALGRGEFEKGRRVGKYAALFHQRQRRPARAGRGQYAAPGRQAFGLRGRHSRPIPRVLAGEIEAGRKPGASHRARYSSDRARGDRRRASADGQAIRRDQYSAASPRRNGAATAEPIRASWSRRRTWTGSQNPASSSPAPTPPTRSAIPLAPLCSPVSGQARRA